MKNFKKSNFLNNKSNKSLAHKPQTSESKTSFIKQNLHSDLSNLPNFLHQQQKEEHHLSHTDRFLAQTKNKLYSSSEKLKQFHKRKTQFQFMNQTLNFKTLNQQLKSTKQNILTKHFLKQYKNNQINPQKYTKSQRLDDYSFNKKCTLIQKVLSQNEALNFKVQLSKKVENLKKQYSDNKIMRDKVIKYFINHQIISRILQQTAKDTSKLQLRKENASLYHQMKEQMVSLLSNQQHFQKHIEQIKHQQQTRMSSLLNRSPISEQKLLKMYIKPKCNANNEKSLLQKIEDLLQISKNNIKQAYVKFGQSNQSNEIELNFKKRLNNNFLIQ